MRDVHCHAAVIGTRRYVPPRSGRMIADRSYGRRHFLHHRVKLIGSVGVIGQQIRESDLPVRRYGGLQLPKLRRHCCSKLGSGRVQPALDRRVRPAATEQSRDLVPDTVPSIGHHSLNQGISG
jgi:hypothetical protein